MARPTLPTCSPAPALPSCCSDCLAALPPAGGAPGCWNWWVLWWSQWLSLYIKCCGRFWPVLSLQYAALLSLVFIIELTAGISGFVFRHEVKTLIYMSIFDPLRYKCIWMSACFQVKETFFITFREAVIRYDGRDDKSVAVDDVQRKVSQHLSQQFYQFDVYGVPLGSILGPSTFWYVLKVWLCLYVYSCTVVECLTTPAGSALCIFLSAAFQPAAALASPTATRRTWRTRRWLQEKSTSRSGGTHTYYSGKGEV